jgi:hypothetical protein
MNLVVEDFDASVAHFGELFGAELMADMPQPQFHACLIDIGQVIFELFVPHAFLLNARYGAHHLGVEYQADMDAVRAAVEAHGLRVVRDIGLALHTHPEDCFGVSFEFYGGYFHDRDWDLLGGKMKPATYWHDTHPLGLAGLKGYSMAVHDIDAASRFLQSFLSAEPVYEADRPELGARAIGLQVADAAVEVMTPTGEGAVQAYLARYGQGIYATRFAVRDIAQARDYFAVRRVALAPGSAPDSIAVPAWANRGVIFEFAE